MAKRAFNLPNMLTYGRILAVPLIVLCFFLEGRLKSSDFARWSALFDLRGGQHHRLFRRLSRPRLAADLEHRPHARSDRRQAAGGDLPAAAGRRPDRTIAGWSLWAAIIILCREILVSGLREYLAGLKVSVPVTQLAKWKTTIQMLAIGMLLAGPALDKLLPYSTQAGIALLWISAIVTLYTGYDYFRAGLKHIIDE